MNLPKPYWQDEKRGVTLWHDDCLRVLPGLPDRSVDMVFCDPPYGLELHVADLLANNHATSWQGSKNGKDPLVGDNREWFTETLPLVFAELARVLVRGGCCCGGGGGPQPIFAEMTLMLDRTPGLRFKQAVVWDKGGLGMGWHYRRNYEFVLVAEKPGAACKWYGGNTVANVVRIPKIIPRADDHPTEKPWELAAFFIRLHSQPGEVVLDCFAGKGSTGVAAQKLGRKFLGIEIDEAHVADAARKLGCVERQLQTSAPNLFNQESQGESV